MTTSIRTANLSDAPDIARVHVQCWQSTYPGILPDDVLDDLSVQSRTQHWQETFENLRSEQTVVVCEKDGEIVGFASGGPEEGHHDDYDGEVYAMYVLDKAQGLGHGQAMLQAIVQSLVQAQISSMLIWVAKDNDSRFFYEAMGGTPVAERAIEIKGTAIDVIAYGWEDIRFLLE